MKQLPDPTPVLGLFEAHLTVHDLQQSIRFYREVVGLPLALEIPQRRAAFLDRPRQTFHARTVGDRILTPGPPPASCIRGEPGRRVGGAAAAERARRGAVVLCRGGDIRA